MISRLSVMKDECDEAVISFNARELLTCTTGEWISIVACRDVLGNSKMTSHALWTNGNLKTV